LEMRFESGHGPTVVELSYKTLFTVEEHNLCKGDVVEAFIDGSWLCGSILAVNTGDFTILDSMGIEHSETMPEHVRPWPTRLLLKPDTVANDMLCFRMFRLFNYLWRHSFIPNAFKPYALDLEVLPAGPQFGIMEFSENSHPAAHYNWDKLYSCNQEQLHVFLRSAAGSIIAGHVLGIGDRHQDNIMLREIEFPKIGTCIQFFQLDFKHCLGMRSRIDADPIAIPSKMKEVLEKIKVENPAWQECDDEETGSSASLPKATKINRFEELVGICGMAFRVLRRSNGFVMHLARLFNRDPKLVAVCESHLTESLCLGMNEEEAVAQICEKVRNSASKLAKLVKDLSHSHRSISFADLSPPVIRIPSKE